MEIIKPELDPERVEEKLRQQLGPALPDQAVNDVHAALALAGSLEGRGLWFSLKDLCPKSMTRSLWRAVFSTGDKQFSADHASPALAVCAAALSALENS